MTNRPWLVEVARRGALGLALPVAIAALMLQVLPWNPYLVAWIVPATVGFYFVSRGLGIAAHIAVAFVYFPAMALFFLWASTTIPFLVFRIPAP